MKLTQEQEAVVAEIVSRHTYTGFSETESMTKAIRAALADPRLNAGGEDANKPAGEVVALDEALAPDVVSMCKKRGWSMHWTHRGSYLHLEASELIEAVRGKRGDPAQEAGDVLLVLMSITENHGIPWRAVVQNSRSKCDLLMTKEHYKGEEYEAHPPTSPPALAQDDVGLVEGKKDE